MQAVSQGHAVNQPEPNEADVQRWLAAIRVESLCQWDVVVFLHRHRTILMSPADLARLMGYQAPIMLATLSTLAVRELIELSPHSSGAARLYRFAAPSEPSRRDALERLLTLGEHRSGRLLLCKHLRRGERSAREGLDAARRILDDAKRVGAIAWRHSEEIRRTIRQRADEQHDRERNGSSDTPEKPHWPRAV